MFFMFMLMLTVKEEVSIIYPEVWVYAVFSLVDA